MSIFTYHYDTTLRRLALCRAGLLPLHIIILTIYHFIVQLLEVLFKYIIYGFFYVVDHLYSCLHADNESGQVRNGHAVSGDMFSKLLSGEELYSSRTHSLKNINAIYPKFKKCLNRLLTCVFLPYQIYQIFFLLEPNLKWVFGVPIRVDVLYGYVGVIMIATAIIARVITPSDFLTSMNLKPPSYLM